MDALRPTEGAADVELDGLLERVSLGLRSLDAMLVRTDEMILRSEIALAHLRVLENRQPGPRG
jgi:hypothetical protein